MRRRFESCRGHINSVLELLTVVMSMALRLISILCTQKMITDGEAIDEYREAVFL